MDSVIARRAINRSTAAFLFFWLVLGIASYLFASSNGLAYADVGSLSKIGYVKNLKSTGNNDNIAIELGVVFSFAGIVWALIRIKKPFRWFDCAAQFVLWALQTIYLMSIEVGSIHDTLMIDRNLILLVWLISFCGLFIVLVISGTQVFLRTRARVQMQ